MICFYSTSQGLIADDYPTALHKPFLPAQLQVIPAETNTLATQDDDGFFGIESDLLAMTSKLAHIRQTWTLGLEFVKADVEAEQS